MSSLPSSVVTGYIGILDLFTSLRGVAKWATLRLLRPRVGSWSTQSNAAAVCSFVMQHGHEVISTLSYSRLDSRGTTKSDAG